MKNLLNKFFKKEEKQEAITATIPKALYNIGWEININGYKKIACDWPRLDENDLKEVRDIVKTEVENMRNALEEAHTQKKEFVNLNNNVFRLSDVTSITSYCYKI